MMQVELGVFDVSEEKDAELMLEISVDENTTTPYYMSIDSSGKRHVMPPGEPEDVYAWIIKTTNAGRTESAVSFCLLSNVNIIYVTHLHEMSYMSASYKLRK